MGEGKRLTVDQRIEMRNRAQAASGRPAGWSDDALDFYLSGEPVSEICRTYNIKSGTLYDSIAKAALYRLMKSANCERMDEMDALTDDKA